MTDKDKRIEDIEAELRVLQSDLKFSNEYGDWKIIKMYEYKLTNKEVPYNIEELGNKRQEVRDRINKLNDELLQLQES